MSREILQDIIKDFELNKFIRFFREKSRSFAPRQETLIQENFNNGHKLGEIKLTDGNLIVCAFKVNQPLSERSGKKAQYEAGKRVLKEHQVDAGIFIFYDVSGNFRFSLIYANYLGKKRDWSTFRRFTYFVSSELTNKTFLQRIGDGDFTSLSKIRGAFSVEKVTKEFYLEYRKLFENLVSELSKNHSFLNEAERNELNTENFAKKLLGQIVFLYFLQRKGWLGAPRDKNLNEGDANFMRNLFEGKYKKYSNFFNDVLEPLFYGALNKRTDKVGNFYRDYFNCQIPFLNGGLFESDYKWEKTKIYLVDKTFGSILDIFDRYNFTVEEESPDDKEIAVDPEMLGKVFENLLPENLRKGKGTYYTPREIVYYMCRESLVNYLVSNHSNITAENIGDYIFYSESFENFQKHRVESFTFGQYRELDDLLKNIKICDPACGSGAFLVGMLNMIVKLRLYLQTTPDFSQNQKTTEYELKKETIQNCIYGVDIDPGAVEIAKLRLWLQLVVDYELGDIEPLPNLDYRLMCGNSLLEEFEGVKFYNGEDEQTVLLVDTEKQEKIAVLKRKVKEYFDIHDDKEKQSKRKEINNIKDWLVRSALERRREDLAAQRKNEEAKTNMLNVKSREKYIASWSDKFLAEGKIKEVLDNLHNPKKEKLFFIWKLEFIDVFEDKKGFDVVIANPPYVASYGRQAKKFNEGEIQLYLKNYDTFASVSNRKNLSINTVMLFLERGLSLLSQKSLLTFIIDQSLLNVDVYSHTRRFLLENFKIREIVSDLQFPQVIAETCIFSISKEQREDDYHFFWKKGLSGKSEKITRLKIKNNNNKFSFSNFDSLISKLESGCSALTDHSETFTGMQIIPEYFLSNDDNVLSSSKWHKAVFSSNIARYAIIWPRIDQKGKYITYDNDLQDRIRRELTLRIEKGEKCRAPETLSIGSREKEYRFFPPKIIVSQTVSNAGGKVRLQAAFDDIGYYGNVSIHIIKNKSENYLKILLALLNSSLISFYCINKKLIFGAESGSKKTPQIRKGSLDQIPIKTLLEEDQKPLIDLVERILAIIKSNNDYFNNSVKQAEVKEYERQIDQMVYKLYDLTPDEIRIVEKNG